MNRYKGGRGNRVLPLFTQQDQYALLTRREYFIVESYALNYLYLDACPSLSLSLALRIAWPQLDPRAGVTVIAAGTI